MAETFVVLGVLATVGIVAYCVWGELAASPLPVIVTDDDDEEDDDDDTDPHTPDVGEPTGVFLRGRERPLLNVEECGP